MRQFTWIALCVLLAACQPGAPGIAPSTASPITGDAITTASLDAPSAETSVAAVAGMAPPASGMVDASMVTGTAVSPPEIAQPQATATPETVVDPQPSAAAGTEALAEPPVAEEEPAPLKSADQIRCEAGGGVFASAVKGGPRTCVRTTKDGGKRCDQESDCEGQCLARSQTCAPINPLMGCNDVLQDNGAKVTLCLN
jgi:hypothetical protein